MIRVAVMEGSFHDFDLPSVIQVVSIGRQYTGVDLSDDAGQLVGTLFLKSGKIVSATSGERSGLDAVYALLRGTKHKRFAVYRGQPYDDVQSPVGSVAEILLRIMATEKRTVTRTHVMDGSLHEFDLVTVLQVVSIGRGLIGIEVRTVDGQLLGTVELKSSKVVSATCGHLKGVDAVRRLVQAPRDSRFMVFRSDAEVGDKIVGPLAHVLMSLDEPSDHWGPEETNTRQHPAVISEAAKRLSVTPPRKPSIPAVPTIATAPASAPAAAPAPAAKADGVAARAEAPADRSAFVDTYTNPRGLTALAPRDGEIPIICVSSPKGGAGKTTMAINLGVALARRGKRVVLVDTDANGVLLVLNAEKKGARGALDVLAGTASLRDVTIDTRIAGLRIVPTGDSVAAPSTGAGWKGLLRDVRAQADIVLVDLPPGMPQTVRDVAALCTHTLIVVPAEPAAMRGLAAHAKKLETLGEEPPKLLGIALNMLDYRARVSLDALRDICGGPYAPWVFDIPIARSPAFMEAVARGVPLACGERSDAPTIGWVFEMLASSILERLGDLKPTLDDAPLV